MMIPSRGSAVWLAAVFAAAVSIGSLGGLASTSRAAPARQPGGGSESPCTCTADRVVGPNVLQQCETTAVTVSVRPGCPGTPVHIVIVIDEVYKPSYSEPKDRTSALRNAVNQLDLRENPHVKVGVVWMQRGSAVRKEALTNEEQRIVSVLDIPVVSRFGAQVQCFDCGFKEAVRILDDGARGLPRNADIHEIVILAPLGIYTAEAVPGVLRGAQRAKSRGATVISTCYAWTHCDPVLRQAASEPRLYLGFGEGARLAAILSDVVRQTASTFLRAVSLVDVLPPGLDLVPGSASPAPDDVGPDGRTPRWILAGPFDHPYTITYRVQPNGLGANVLGGGRVALTDSLHRDFGVVVPTGWITVVAPCAVPPTPTPEPPTPTDTATPTPTDTPPPTPTPSPLPPTPTSVPPTPAPTATPKPAPIYLPLVVREQCRPDKVRADIVLVLDASSSMLEPTRSGRPKLAAAAEAARLFVDRLDFAPDAAGKADQAALVVFNRAATTLVPLGRDHAALAGALASIDVDLTTRLDLGVAAGTDALFGTARDSRNQAVMIVLTDGRANPVPVEAAIAAADAAKARGAQLYTVGLGNDVDDAALRSMASRAGMYRIAPDGEDLSAVYRDFTADIACRADPFWPQ